MGGLRQALTQALKVRNLRQALRQTLKQAFHRSSAPLGPAPLTINITNITITNGASGTAGYTVHNIEKIRKIAKYNSYFVDKMLILGTLSGLPRDPILIEDA